MGNHRFKLSDMIPNAWFYKLKDMSRSRKQKGSHATVKNKASSPVMSQRSPPNYLHYFPTEPYRAGMLFNSPIQTKVTDFSFTDSPRKSSKRRVQRKTIYKPSPSVLSSVSTSCSCHWTQPNQAESPDFYASSIESSSSELDLYECITSDSDECDISEAPHMVNGPSPDCSCRVSSSTNDIIIDMNHEPFAMNPEKLDGFDAISELGLPPILTKPVKFDGQAIDAPYLKCSSKLEESSRTTTPKSSSNSRGIKLRVNSAKLASRKVQACARRSVSSSSSSSACKVSRKTGFPDGVAVVKSSIDPQRDFKDSMVEMIRENNIWSSEELEDLLACYLSLNSREYHQLIIKAFEQTWFDLAQLRM